MCIEYYTKAASILCVTLLLLSEICEIEARNSQYLHHKSICNVNESEFPSFTLIPLQRYTLSQQICEKHRHTDGAFPPGRELLNQPQVWSAALLSSSVF